MNKCNFKLSISTVDSVAKWLKQLENDQDIRGPNPTSAKISFVQFIEFDGQFWKKNLNKW